MATTFLYTSSVMSATAECIRKNGFISKKDETRGLGTSTAKTVLSMVGPVGSATESPEFDLGDVVAGEEILSWARAFIPKPTDEFLQKSCGSVSGDEINAKLVPFAVTLFGTKDRFATATEKRDKASEEVKNSEWIGEEKKREGP